MFFLQKNKKTDSARYKAKYKRELFRTLDLQAKVLTQLYFPNNWKMFILFWTFEHEKYEVCISCSNIL